MVNLKTLDLRATSLAGQLPSEIGLCTKLTMLDLWGSNLTGTVPNEIGNVKFLESLTFGSASLAGPLPTEIGQLSRLHTLWVTTWLTDAFVALTRLTSLTLVSCAVHSGQDSSTLPTEVGRLTVLESLAFVNDGWTGTLPTELARLTKLTSLELSTNLFVGTIPTELGLLTDLVVLDLSENYVLTGFVASEVGALTNLRVANFVYTKLSDQIPPEVCALGLEVKISKDISNEGYFNYAVIDACK